MKHAEKEEAEEEEIKAEEKKIKREIDEKEAENEYVTQTTEKVDLEEKAERDARILDYVARKVAGVEAVMAWREINLSQAAQVPYLVNFIILMNFRPNNLLNNCDLLWSQRKPQR